MLTVTGRSIKLQKSPLPDGLEDTVCTVSLSRRMKQLISSVGFCCLGFMQPDAATELLNTINQIYACPLLTHMPLRNS